MKRILTLGGTGFLGSAVANKLAHHGCDVRVYSPSADKLKNEILQGVKGVLQDTDSLQEQIRWADEIHHYISTTTPRTSEADPVHDLQSNLIPFIHLLEILKSYPDKKFVFCSSGGGVYGIAQTNQIGEEHPRNPVTSYGLVKKIMEDYVLYYHYHYGIPYLILRPSNIYGPKLRSVGKQGIISTLIMNGMKGLPTQIWSDPLIRKDYLYIDDLADAVLALENQFGIYNIGSGHSFNLLEITNMIHRVLKLPLSLVYEEKQILDVNCILDVDKISKCTAWSSSTLLESGIEKTKKGLEQF